MADHAEHLLDAPVHHRLGHHVGDRALVRGLGLEPDEDGALTNLHRVQRLPAVRVAAGGLAGQRIEVPAMPGAADPALPIGTGFDRAFTQRAALVRAAVVHRGPLALEVRQADRLAARCHGLDAALGQLVDTGHTEPFQRVFIHRMLLEFRPCRRRQRRTDRTSRVSRW